MDAYNIDSTKTENEQLLIDSELKLGGRMSKEMAADLHLQLEKMREEWDDHEPDFLPPRKKIDLSTLRGKLKLDMTIDEIDALTKSWRDEWERDFS
jgi:hypothetical protein